VCHGAWARELWIWGCGLVGVGVTQASRVHRRERTTWGTAKDKVDCQLWDVARKSECESL
jgi:hypothetical protein